MNNFPKPIEIALERKIEFFCTSDATQWKLELLSESDFVKIEVGAPVMIFANNGYGDYLFVKLVTDKSIDIQVFEYLHEGPRIEKLDENLEVLLGLREREPSQDNYPKARYENGEPVRLGDIVQYRFWLFFWRGWSDGVVSYVPGQSPKSPQLEYNGLKWIEIKGRDESIGTLVDYQTGIVKKVRLVRRVESTEN